MLPIPCKRGIQPLTNDTLLPSSGALSRQPHNGTKLGTQSQTRSTTNHPSTFRMLAKAWHVRNSGKALVHCHGYQPLSVFTCGLMPGCILGTMAGEKVRWVDKSQGKGEGSSTNSVTAICDLLPFFRTPSQVHQNPDLIMQKAREGAMPNRSSNKQVEEKTRNPNLDPKHQPACKHMECKAPGCLNAEEYAPQQVTLKSGSPGRVHGGRRPSFTTVVHPSLVEPWSTLKRSICGSLYITNRALRSWWVNGILLVT